MRYHDVEKKYGVALLRRRSIATSFCNYSELPQTSNLVQIVCHKMNHVSGSIMGTSSLEYVVNVDFCATDIA